MSLRDDGYRNKFVHVRASEDTKERIAKIMGAMNRQRKFMSKEISEADIVYVAILELYNRMPKDNVNT